MSRWTILLDSEEQDDHDCFKIDDEADKAGMGPSRLASFPGWCGNGVATIQGTFYEGANVTLEMVEALDLPPSRKETFAYYQIRDVRDRHVIFSHWPTLSAKEVGPDLAAKVAGLVIAWFQAEDLNRQKEKAKEERWHARLKLAQTIKAKVTDAALAEFVAHGFDEVKSVDVRIEVYTKDAQ